MPHSGGPLPVGTSGEPGLSRRGKAQAAGGFDPRRIAPDRTGSAPGQRRDMVEMFGNGACVALAFIGLAH